MTSLRHDREVKVPAYGRFGIPECWIVDVNAGRVIRYREPTAEGYATRDAHARGELRAVRFPALRLDLAALWAATFPLTRRE